MEEAEITITESEPREDINNIESDIMVRDAIEKSKAAFEAVNTLLVTTSATEMIARISGALANQFSLNPDDLTEVLTDKLCSEIHTVSNPEALAGWLFRVGENYCKNLYKHSRVIKRHEEYIEHLNIAGKRNSIPVVISASSTPEDELIQKEEKPIWDERMSEIRARVRRIIMEDVIIASGWGKGEKPEIIAEEIQKSVATVYRKLAIMQKAVIDEIGLIETDQNKSIIKEGLRELFVNSLEGVG
jgi:hypothetical protein